MGKNTDYRRLEGRLLLVNLKSGDALRGRLSFGRGDVITLEAVTLFDVDNPDGAELAGAAHVDRAEVNFAQELPPATVLPPPADDARQTG